MPYGTAGDFPGKLHETLKRTTTLEFTTISAILYIHCWAQLFFNQGKFTSIGSTSGGEILLHSGL